MLRRREQSKQRANGRRLLFGLAVVGAGLLFAGGLAFAASDTIVGQVDSTYNAASYTADQGEVVPFQVTGGQHNATANQKGLDGQALTAEVESSRQPSPRSDLARTETS